MYGNTTEIPDSFLLSKGIVRLEIPLPFKEAGGPANAYAILDVGNQSHSLFDTGFGNEIGRTALFSQMKQHGITNISRIIVSHGHIDHYGNAQELAEIHSCPVHVHQLDYAKVTGAQRYGGQVIEHRDYFLQLGVPEKYLEEIQLRSVGGQANLARNVNEMYLRDVKEGHSFQFAHFEANVLHCPGHTPGLICLYAPTENLLFADDHVLARVSPNPLIDLSLGTGDTKFKSLIEYLKSATRVRNLELSALLPGHGPAFSGHVSVLDGLFEFYVKRQNRIMNFLKERPRNAFEVATLLFPSIDSSRLMLVLSEALGNLEVLEHAGRIKRLLHESSMIFESIS
jgi:glyoxylase-like metal-dependent hydrolase (beta-lactamase superfamily II)